MRCNRGSVITVLVSGSISNALYHSRRCAGIPIGEYSELRHGLMQIIGCDVDLIVAPAHLLGLATHHLHRGHRIDTWLIVCTLADSPLDAALALQAINMGADDVLRKPFHREELVTALTLALNISDLAREVRIRRLMTERLSRRVEDLKRLIADSHQRPNTIKRIEGLVSASRQRNGKSLTSLESSLDRLWKQANRAHARLDVAQHRLLVKQQESREGVLKRVASR
jgi:DNA-binding response OmpR family regulator